MGAVLAAWHGVPLAILGTAAGLLCQSHLSTHWVAVSISAGVGYGIGLLGIALIARAEQIASFVADISMRVILFIVAFSLLMPAVSWILLLGIYWAGQIEQVDLIVPFFLQNWPSGPPGGGQPVLFSSAWVVNVLALLGLVAVAHQLVGRLMLAIAGLQSRVGRVP